MDVKFPIGKLQVPEKVTLADVSEWLQEIDRYTDQLREVVGTLDEEQLQKTYREGSYTVRQLIHHIVDSQLIMFGRLKLALTDDNPVVPAFDQDKWAVQPDTELPVETSIKILEGINARIVALGRSLTAEQLDRVFTHEHNGEITVGTKLAKLCWHEKHHLAHIKLALKN